jgi:hypothetical protein
MKSVIAHAPILGLLACLSACSMLQGHEADGVYTSPDGEFSVMAPHIGAEKIVDGSFGTNNRYVDFSMDGFWMAAGLYSVEWYKLDKSYADEAHFVEAAKDSLPKEAAHDFGESFKPVETEVTQVNGHAAFRLVAEGMHDKLDAYWVATAINFGDRVALVALLAPKDTPQQRGPASSSEAVSWHDYPAFIQSIIRH